MAALAAMPAIGGALLVGGTALVSAGATSYASAGAIEAQSVTAIANLNSQSETDQAKSRSSTAINITKNSAETLDYAKARS